MIISIKSHGTYYPVDASSLWYSPTSRRWHGQILGDCKPFTRLSHGGPMDMNTFAALRDEFVLEDVDAADTCPFCGVEFGKHRLDVTCPCPPKEVRGAKANAIIMDDVTYSCPPKVCEHKNKEVMTSGRIDFIGGNVQDTLRDVLVCADCGEELDSE